MTSSQFEQKNPEKSGLSVEKGLPTRPFLRIFLICFGWLNVGFAAVGVVVPGIPTTIFLIIALWAFSQSSKRLHSWLYNHRLFGTFLQNWKRYGVIPSRAKKSAILVMLASWLLLVFTSKSWIVGGGVGLVMLCVATFIVTRPSVPFGKQSS
jgi:uncharacterized membrane protein YbaN (DUF454 family)